MPHQTGMGIFIRLIFAGALVAFAFASRPALAADDFDSLRAGIAAANRGSGGRVNLTGDIILSAPLPAITGRVTIEGGGHSISGDDMFRILDVDGGTLNIRDATLTGGKAADSDGGAIRLRNGAQVTLERATLSANSALHGGAIAMSDSSDRLSVSDSNFAGNIARQSAGAIYVKGGAVSISNSNFEKNCALFATFRLVQSGGDRGTVRSGADGCFRVNYVRTEIDADIQSHVDGGAIRLLHGARVEIEDSTFRENKASYGGALSTGSKNVRLSVSGSSFVGNRASESGGAIGGSWLGGGRISINSSSFVENYAEESDGGAIDAQNHTLDIDNSTFSKNSADNGGGALKVDEDAKVTITHATFVDNRTNGGVATAITNSGGTVHLRNSIIVSSRGGTDCVGVGEQNRGNLSTDGTCAERPGDDPMLGDISGSPAYYPLLDRSPAVDYADPEFCLETDQLGTPRPQGGGCDIGAIEGRSAIAAEPTPVPPLVCTLAHQIIAANRDRPSSGCPAGSGVDTIVLDRDIILFELLPAITSPIIIEGNGYSISAEGRIRIFDVDGGTLTVKNLTMAEGRAGKENGGAIKLHNHGRAIVSDSRFIGNAARNGSAVFINWTGTERSRLTVKRSSFVNNRGSVIFAGGGSISIESSSFVSNSSAVISIVNPFTRLDAVNSSFIKSGSAVFAENGAVANLTHVTVCCGSSPLRTAKDAFTTEGWFNVYNSILVGSVPSDVCDSLRQNISNFIADGSCSPRLSGDPDLAEADDSSTHLELLPGSAAINAADMRFCPESDQLGRARSTFGRCDIGAIEAVPVSQALSTCVVTTTHLLNFRDGPGGNVIGGVPQNATLSVVARTPRWFEVEHEGETGWISADYVVKAGECDLE